MKKVFEITTVILGVLALAFACSQPAEDTELINLKVTGMI